MLISQNTPAQESEKRIFNQDAPLLIALGFLALIFQGVSGYTEYLGLKEALLPALGEWGGKFAAAVISFSLEYAILFLVVYIVNAIYDGYLTSKDYDNAQRKSNRIKFGLMSFFLIALVSVSMWLSKNNTRAVLKAKPIAAVVEDTDKFDDQLEREADKIESRYQDDLRRLEESHAKKIAATSALHQSEIGGLNIKYENYERKEQRTNKSYSTKKSNLLSEIEQEKSKQSKALSELEESYTSQLTSLQEKRDKSLSKTESRIVGRQSNVEGRNTATRSAIKTLNDQVSDFIANYAQFSTIAFLIIMIWICLSLNTAGIKPKVFVKPEMFEGSLLQEIYLLCSTLVTRRLRNATRRRLGQIEALEAINSSVVIDVDADHPETRIVPMRSKPVKVATGAMGPVGARLPSPPTLPAPPPPETDSATPFETTSFTDVSGAETKPVSSPVSSHVSETETSPETSGKPETDTETDSATPFETTSFAGDSGAETKPVSSPVSETETKLSREEVAARIKHLKRGIQSYKWKLLNKVGRKETAERNIKEKEAKIKALENLAVWKKI